MDEYFSSVTSRSALKGSDKFIDDDARPDLANEHYKLIRRNELTKDKVAQIDDMYREWVNLLSCGYNILVRGAQSKFCLIETFCARYLEQSCLVDWKTIFKAKKADDEAPVKTQIVHLHGLDAIKAERFNYALFDIDKRGPENFINKLIKTKEHFIFIIHSIDYFIRDSEDVFESITQLYHMLPNQIHFVMSSDVINASKKLTALKFELKLVAFDSLYSEPFVYERNQLFSEFDLGRDGHQPLFSDRVDLQSLKDVYHALGNTNQIMLFILKDFIEKSETIKVPEAKSGSSEDSEDSEEENRLHKKRLTLRSAKDFNELQTKKSKTIKIDTSIDFQHLLRVCETNFWARRAVSLKEHLRELVDHQVITMNPAESKIKCIIETDTCKKFIKYVEGLNKD